MKKQYFFVNIETLKIWWWWQGKTHTNKFMWSTRRKLGRLLNNHIGLELWLCGSVWICKWVGIFLVPLMITNVYTFLQPSYFVKKLKGLFHVVHQNEMIYELFLKDSSANNCIVLWREKIVHEWVIHTGYLVEKKLLMRN